MTMSEAQGQRVVVIGPDGQPVGYANVPGADSRAPGDDGSPEGVDGSVDPADAIGEPAKVMRIGTMIKQLLEEVRAAPLDEASRARLMQVHQRSIKELETGLTPDLRDELERLSLPFTEETVPSEGELRIAQAQLVGWLEGVFHGLQAALVAQQMAARAQLEQMRRGLPPGHSGQEATGAPGPGAGQYL
jgi:hypothetical protein